MADTPFAGRPITRKSARASRRNLLPPLKRNSKTFTRTVERLNFQYLMAVGERYHTVARKWNPGADFLFRCLIHALDLEDHENFILRAAKPKRGRRSNTDLAERIQWEKSQGKTAKQIAATLKAAGTNLSVQGVQSYSKGRRTRPRT
jgi:hypothetical protein